LQATDFICRLYINGMELLKGMLFIIKHNINIFNIKKVSYIGEKYLDSTRHLSFYARWCGENRTNANRDEITALQGGNARLYFWRNKTRIP